MTQKGITFNQTVSEADIDWIVCVELNSCVEFRTWLSSLIFKDHASVEHIGAYRSVSTAVGESDLIWVVQAPQGGQCLALIENKIKAPAQPDQYERYVQRATEYIYRGICSEFVTVLLAPQGYRSQDSESYDVRINYETVRDWLSGKDSDRSTYLASLFEKAISKRNSAALPDSQISSYLKRVWEIARVEFPGLNIPEPGEVSASQYWIYMRYPGFTIIYKIFKKANKFGKCVVDLELAGRADDIEMLEKHYAQALDSTGISLVTTGKSVCFRLEVPPVSPLEIDEENIRTALKAASKLLKWWQPMQFSSVPPQAAGQI